MLITNKKIMADSRQISVAFKFVDKGGGIKVISASVESLQKAISATVAEVEKLKKKNSYKFRVFSYRHKCCKRYYK